MFKIDETILKVIVLLSLLFAVLFLAYSGGLFHLGEFDEAYMLLHKSAGVLLVILTLIHIFMKRNKVKKISEEFVDLLLNKDIKHTNNKEELLEILKEKSLEDISILFNIKIEDILLTLERNSLKVGDSKQKLNKIAKENSKDLYKVFILILKDHMKKPKL